MSKVVITDFPFGTPDVEEAILGPLGCELVVAKSAPPPAELARLVEDADHVLTVFAPLTAAVIAAMRRARCIVRYGVGVDNVDLEAAWARGVPVCNVPDYCMDEVADHTLALMLALTRQVVPNCNSLRGGRWGLAVPAASMRALAGLTVGVVGLGRIGREVLRRLLAFRCRALVFDPVVPAEEVRRQGAEPVSFDDVLARSDLLTLHCPATGQTKGMINREALARMRPGAVLINVGRGSLVDTQALIKALESGHLAGAGLDVFDPEPLPADCPLLKMDNVVVSAHVAAVSVPAVRRLRETAAGIVAKAVRGEALPNVVNGPLPRPGG
jgi:D-3-phosphoglycerate dehydrogenase